VNEIDDRFQESLLRAARAAGELKGRLDSLSARLEAEQRRLERLKLENTRVAFKSVDR
jgi:hypothetical protein